MSHSNDIELPGRASPEPVVHLSMEEQMDLAQRGRGDDADFARRVAADGGRTRAFRALVPGANQTARVGDFDWEAHDEEQRQASVRPPDPDPDLDNIHRGPVGDAIDTTASPSDEGGGRALDP